MCKQTYWIVLLRSQGIDVMTFSPWPPKLRGVAIPGSVRLAVDGSRKLGSRQGVGWAAQQTHPGRQVHCQGRLGRYCTHLYPNFSHFQHGETTWIQLLYTIGKVTCKRVTLPSSMWALYWYTCHGQSDASWMIIPGGIEAWQKEVAEKTESLQRLRMKLVAGTSGT